MGTAYLDTRPVLPPKPADPPPDTPGAMRVGAESAIAFERAKWEFASGTCLACRGTSLDATYRKGGGGGEISLRRYADNQGVFTEKNNAPPTWRGAVGETRYDAPVAIADLTPAEKRPIARLSVTVAIHHLAHGGVATTGHASTLPKPVGSMAAALPRSPADVTIIRGRRGAAGSASKKQNRLYAVRRKKVMDAPLLPKEHNPYCADVVLDPPG